MESSDNRTAINDALVAAVARRWRGLVMFPADVGTYYTGIRKALRAIDEAREAIGAVDKGDVA